MDTEYKRIRRFNKFLTTKKISGGIRYLLAPIKSKKGPVLMASETVGISNTQSDFIFYKYATPYVPPTPPTPPTPIEGEVLLAQEGVKLLASQNLDVSYLNNPQILSNTLNNQDIGMKAFKLSFSIMGEFVSLSTGTHYILSYPGLMDVKTEDGTLWFKFNWEARPVWKYISSSELVTGWNSVTLSSNGAGVITLVVNSTTHTLIDSNVLPTYRWFSGFSDSSYILPNNILEHYDEGQTTGEISSYEHIIKIKLTTFGTSEQSIMDAGAKNSITVSWIHSIRWTITTSGFIHYRVRNSSSGSYPINITGTEKLPLNTDILCKASYNKTTGYLVEHSVDDGNTWVVDGTSSVTASPYTESANGWYPRLGENPATGTSLQGSIDLAHTVFKCNGKEEFNGATAVESGTIRENAFIVSGTLTEDTDKQEYPASIATGKLTLAQPWTVLKDVEAQLLGSVEPPTPVDPEPGPTYDDEGAPVSAKELPKGWAMFKIISAQGDLNNNNWYRYTQELPHEVVDGWHPVTSYTLPSIDSTHDNSPIGLAEWYPSYLAKGWLYVYSSSGPDYEAKLIRNRIND